MESSFFDKLKNSTADINFNLFSKTNNSDSTSGISNLNDDNSLFEQPVKITLSGGTSLNDKIIAHGFPEQVKDAKIMWFISPEGGELEEIDLNSYEYQPKFSDNGARICAQWMTNDGMVTSNFAQIGPLNLILDTVLSDIHPPLLSSPRENVLQNNLDAALSENKELVKTIQRLKDKVFERDLQIASNKSDLIKQEEIYNVFKSQNETINIDNKNFKEEMKKLQSHLSTVTSERDVCLEDLNTMNLTVKSLMEEISTLESENSKLISDLNLLQNKYNDLDLQTTGDLSNLNLTMSEKGRLIASLTEQIELVKFERKSIRSELSNSFEIIEASNKKISVLECAVEDFKQSLEKERELVRSFQLQNEHDALEIQQLYLKQNDLQSLVNSLRVSAFQYSEQEAKITQLSDELSLKSKEFDELISDINKSKEFAVKSRDEVIAERNFFKRKAESLSQDIEKLLKNSSKHIEKNTISNVIALPSSPKNSMINLELIRLQKSESELKSSCEFYIKALEEHILRRKQEEQKSLHHNDLSDSQLQSQNKNLQVLANQYMETIIDKDMQMEHQKSIIKLLGQRIQELEKLNKAKNGIS